MSNSKEKQTSGLDALEKFRDQWKKELDVKQSQSISFPSKEPSTSYSKSNSDSHRDESKISQVNHFSDYHLPSVNSELVGVALQDDTSCDAFDFETKSSAGQNESASEYYPFQILTQFLNEAPQRKDSKRTKSVLESPPYTVSKRRYFQESDEHHKKLKNDRDDCVNQDNVALPNKEDKPMLDIFLADLDEINEIPFFDTSVPREVAMKIFHHLDMKSLCSCSQVSRSWRSLADDELLWFNVYLRLGLSKIDSEILHVSQGSDWKGRVRRLVVEKDMLHANWKARLGKPYQLNYAQGGVLCAVHSHGSNIVAGYTSCNVRSWDTLSGDILTYNASNTALVLDENADDDVLCRMENSVQHIQTTGQFTAASFTHGFVDVWSSEEGTEPVHTLPFNNRGISYLALSSVPSNNQSCVVAASQGSRIQVAQLTADDARSMVDFNVTAQVSQLDWLHDQPSHHLMNLLVTCPNTVHIKTVEMPTEPRPAQSTTFSEMKEVHNIFWAPITAVSLRPGSTHLAVGFDVLAGPSTEIKVNIYDMASCQLTKTLTGHTWVITSIDLPEMLPHQLVTGSGDRKIRLYDTRAASFPMLTLAGHSARVTCVKMDDWKVVSADEAGFVCVWDPRMARKLWDIHNRHPVRYCHFEERLLITGNIPYQKFPETDEFDKVSSIRYRGTLQVYDFLANQQRQDIPSICLSAYDEPEAYDYNIGLSMPYDKVV